MGSRISPTPDRASPHPARALSYPCHGSAPSRQDPTPRSILQKPETSSDSTDTLSQDHKALDHGCPEPSGGLSWQCSSSLSIRQPVMLLPTHTPSSWPQNQNTLYFITRHAKLTCPVTETHPFVLRPTQLGGQPVCAERQTRPSERPIEAS